MCGASPPSSCRKLGCRHAPRDLDAASRGRFIAGLRRQTEPFVSFDEIFPRACSRSECDTEIKTGARVASKSVRDSTFDQEPRGLRMSSHAVFHLFLCKMMVLLLRMLLRTGDRQCTLVNRGDRGSGRLLCECKNRSRGAASGSQAAARAYGQPRTTTARSWSFGAGHGHSQTRRTSPKRPGCTFAP